MKINTTTIDCMKQEINNHSKKIEKQNCVNRLTRHCSRLTKKCVTHPLKKKLLSSQYNRLKL